MDKDKIGIILLGVAIVLILVACLITDWGLLRFNRLDDDIVKFAFHILYIVSLVCLVVAFVLAILPILTCRSGHNSTIQKVFLVFGAGFMASAVILEAAYAQCNMHFWLYTGTVLAAAVALMSSF
uniref:MARVEL domain-containing protein n=1 Tax=Mesocestoides corti TaxID=53468 RepID=A0A5K3EJK1_MESCO